MTRLAWLLSAFIVLTVVSPTASASGLASGVPFKQGSDCDPNYSGCVPIASDVDCAGGSGNGPAYVQGPIKVIGRDIYDLDRDGDGTACE
ncbi:excalibur domain-containing protein [Mycolicibacterium sp. 120266]|uniref:excalibur domain-containing protein n=1 Tax=Mycolicibacterium sp. 120266 TaxID=3090601 RepID=UPI00299DAC43|nr:excalibur domain-containing protein [Mycolicibacterium sp. 120266]MDX1870584.1 excalibur domain-containing protein [Mycolicibacterium sp. 120266]